jgi:hypothetical protein
MWPFDRRSPLPPDLSEKLDRLLHQQRVILLHLGLTPDPVPRPASPSSPAPTPLTPAAIHVVTRQSVITQERVQARHAARVAAGLEPPEGGRPPSSPPPAEAGSPASPSPPRSAPPSPPPPTA